MSDPCFPKSNAVFPDLGVLLALPKLAKAPLPSPKAEEAPVLVGEARAGAEERELKGLLLRLLRLPNRLEEVDSVSLRSDLFMLRLNLLLLMVACMVSIGLCTLDIIARRLT